jgi:type IV conjugative transfer system coupling protein TraD
MSHTLTEGGQITSHRLRMFKQVVKIALLASFVIGLLLFLILMSRIPQNIYISAGYYLKAWVFQWTHSHIDVNQEFLAQTLRLKFQQSPSLPIDYVLRLTNPHLQELMQKTNVYFTQSATVSGFCFIGILIFFFYRGRVSQSKKHLSGSKIVSPFWLDLSLRLKRKASPIKIGPIHLAKNTETQHLMITGGTGSGKTNCLHHLLAQIREKNQKAIIVDTSGIFFDRYFKESQDILLNPFHEKSANWSPWSEGCESFDYASLAEAFIPTSHSDNENYWRMASKTVFTSLLEKFSDTKKTSEIIRWLQYEPLMNLCKIVEGTKAAAHIDATSEKTASSIRSVASTFLECLENLKDTEEPFSIREWLAKDDSSWLFLQCTPNHRSILKPLMTAWISSAVRGLLSLPIDLTRRIWFSIDELPTLNRIKDLESLVTEGRKYGGCGIITLQSPAQLESIYGRDVAKIIIGNTSTKVIFRERDPEIAERISRSFGQQEVREIQEGITYGAHEARDGVSLSMQHKTRPVISVSQIVELPTNTAYVKLAEENSITKVKFQIAKSFH